MRWGTCNPEQKTDVFVVWNAEQERASAVIQRKFKSIKGMEGKLKKTVLKGRQHHVERRLWDTTPESATIGELAGLPGMNEEVYTAYAGPLPQKRKHHLPMPGITDNTYPDEIIPLRNPKKSEPRLSVEIVKKVFPPEDDKPHDGENVVRNDEVWAPCHVCSCLRHCYVGARITMQTRPLTLLLNMSNNILLLK